MKLSMNGTLLLLWCLLETSSVCGAASTMNTSQSMSDGESIVSSDGSFKLGFFEAGNAKGRYLGIWYNKISVTTIVWVANRNQPLINSSGGVLMLTNQGIIRLLDHTGRLIWSTNSSRPARNPVAELQGSGNLVVKEDGENNPENFLWQSFDYPSDTLLPGMKLGWNRRNDFNRYLTSWKSTDDPSVGNFMHLVDPEGYPEMIVKQGSIERFRLGVWNGLHFNGKTNLKPNPLYTYEFVNNENEIYYSYNLINNSLVSRVVINPTGQLQRFTWNDWKQNWQLYYTVQTDDCDLYALCGSNSICNINNSPICSCLSGFEPKNAKEWDLVDWSSGCARKSPLNCLTDGFWRYPAVKLPDTRKSWWNSTLSLEECGNLCKRNCSCTAYSILNVTNGGSGCLLWFEELIDIRILSQSNQDQDLYIRMSASELGDNESNTKKRKVAIVVSVLVTGLLVLSALTLCIWKRKQWHRKVTSIPLSTSKYKLHSEDLELPLYDFASIATATNNFAEHNKLGEGGYGPVYKGVLKDGQEIAVKRLSKDSDQGLDEFKNEVKHISRLQHRNLVKLLGCCIQEKEQMLVYELMPNKSLDFFIFDKGYNTLLNWSNRYNIICGIARGLLYLHQDSRLRIIHRDLKVENILLDHEMNPKISDFGAARSFGGHETEGNTSKVVGTLGYMSPEYTSEGLYSTKSDVFSFGVIVLEIISGRRNRKFCHPDHRFNLLGHAWILYRENRTLELIPETARDKCNISEALRSIQIGLLCVQSEADDRPSMSGVGLMLSGEGALPQPKQPGFFAEKDFINQINFSSRNPYSINGMSITLLEAR